MGARKRETPKGRGPPFLARGEAPSLHEALRGAVTRTKLVTALHQMSVKLHSRGHLFSTKGHLGLHDVTRPYRLPT